MSARLEERVKGGRLIGQQISQSKAENRREPKPQGGGELKRTTLPRKASNEARCTRTKTDTGRRGENPKVREKTLVKELGKMHP